ncbi:hypothetical protein MKEN_00138600 [Mycena kentingensis (nom. inval.)]|nr:hypothetical protein MKEN_00138600 [Mycena kentingensis (nom. inval.)]
MALATPTPPETLLDKPDAAAISSHSRPASRASDHSDVEEEAQATSSSGGFTILSRPQIEPQPQPTRHKRTLTAAEAYPWLYMNSTLDACFNDEPEPAGGSSESEQLQRPDFKDASTSDQLADSAPFVMQSFLAHGDACAVIESDALSLATAAPSIAEEDEMSPMRPYNAMLDRIESLQRECTQLHASIVALTQAGEDDAAEEPSARAQMVSLFSSCLPMLQARADNLHMAQELLEGAKESLAMSLHLETLEGDEEEEE